MVGGTIADLFKPDDRGRAMNLFTLATFAGQVCPIESVSLS
jgi:hypothetical protein